jgi:hypothetical protein
VHNLIFLSDDIADYKDKITGTVSKGLYPFCRTILSQTPTDEFTEFLKRSSPVRFDAIKEALTHEFEDKWEVWEEMMEGRDVSFKGDCGRYKRDPPKAWDLFVEYLLRGQDEKKEKAEAMGLMMWDTTRLEQSGAIKLLEEMKDLSFLEYADPDDLDSDQLQEYYDYFADSDDLGDSDGLGASDDLEHLDGEDGDNEYDSNADPGELASKQRAVIAKSFSGEGNEVISRHCRP